jgi:hypothetical protein
LALAGVPVPGRICFVLIFRRPASTLRRGHGAVWRLGHGALFRGIPQWALKVGCLRIYRYGGRDVQSWRLIELLVLRHIWSTRRRHAADGHAGYCLLSGSWLAKPLFGSSIQQIDIGMARAHLRASTTFQGGTASTSEDLIAAATAAALVALLSLFFQKTATGRALWLMTTRQAQPLVSR